MRRAFWLEASMFTALVYIATVAIQVYQPATGGYFNLGEAVIYLAAMMSSPLVAGLAGGIGAALADATTGFSIFAPGTLVIKFAEGVVAGYLSRSIRKFSTVVQKASMFTAMILYGVLVAILGFKYLSGKASLGTAWSSIMVEIPGLTWIAVGAIVSLAIALLYVRKLLGVEASPLLLAGLIMVIGYFLYEYFVSNPLTGRPPEDAIAEIPINIGQAAIGASIASLLAGFLKKAGYLAEE